MIHYDDCEFVVFKFNNPYDMGASMSTWTTNLPTINTTFKKMFNSFKPDYLNFVIPWLEKYAALVQYSTWMCTADREWVAVKHDRVVLVFKYYDDGMMTSYFTLMVSDHTNEKSYVLKAIEVSSTAVEDVKKYLQKFCEEQ